MVGATHNEVIIGAAMTIMVGVRYRETIAANHTESVGGGLNADSRRGQRETVGAAKTSTIASALSERPAPITVCKCGRQPEHQCVRWRNASSGQTRHRTFRRLRRPDGRERDHANAGTKVTIVAADEMTFKVGKRDDRTQKEWGHRGQRKQNIHQSQCGSGDEGQQDCAELVSQNVLGVVEMSAKPLRSIPSQTQPASIDVPLVELSVGMILCADCWWIFPSSAGSDRRASRFRLMRRLFQTQSVISKSGLGIRGRRPTATGCDRACAATVPKTKRSSSDPVFTRSR